MKLTSLVVLSIAVLFSASVASAAVVNVDVNGWGQIYGTQQLYTGQGALATNDAHIWNGVDGFGTYIGQPTPLVDSAGNATALTFTSVEVSGTGEGGLLSGSARGNLLLDDYAYCTNTAQPFTIGGLIPGGKYDLYLYGTGGQTEGQGTTFTVISEAGNPSASTTSGTMAGVTGSAIDASTAGAYYVKFSDLTATAGGEITATYVTNGNTPYGVFNGLQIASVPEPATMSLIGLGALALLRRRR